MPGRPGIGRPGMGLPGMGRPGINPSRRTGARVIVPGPPGCGAFSGRAGGRSGTTGRACAGTGVDGLAEAAGMTFGAGRAVALRWPAGTGLSDGGGASGAVAVAEAPAAIAGSRCGAGSRTGAVTGAAVATASLATCTAGAGGRVAVAPLPVAGLGAGLCAFAACARFPSNTPFTMRARCSSMRLMCVEALMPTLLSSAIVSLLERFSSFASSWTRTVEAILSLDTTVTRKIRRQAGAEASASER